MSIDKKMNYEIQAGVKNYKPSKMVTVPKTAKSSPTHPTAHLAYITDKEKKLLIKKNLHGSLKGKPNKGPGGIPSLQGDFGGPGGFGGFRGGGDYSSAETGNFSGFDGTGGGGPELPPGVDRKPSKEAQDIRSAAIVAGAGQRVNPGFFDSKDVISPEELARARAYARDRQNIFAKEAMRRTRGGGLMSFITGGGFIGNLIRTLGQKFGLGKRFDQPTYDMSRLSGLPLGGSAAFQNLDIRDKFNREGNLIVDEDDEDVIVGPETDNRFLGFQIGEENKGLPGTRVFANSPFVNADFVDQMGNYTNMMERNVPISDDEQMFIDNEIAANRFN